MIINEIETIFNRVIRNPKYSWIVGSDICLSKEDILQELYVIYLETVDKEYITSSTALLTSFVINHIKNIRRDYESQKRGGGELNNTYLSDMEQGEVDRMSFLFSGEKSVYDIVRSTVHLLDQELGNKDSAMLVDYYAIGLTFDELAVKYMYKNRAGANNYLDRVLDRLRPTIKEYFYDLQELQMK